MAGNGNGKVGGRALAAFCLLVGTLLFVPWTLLADHLDPMLVSILVRVALALLALASLALLGARYVARPRREGFRQSVAWTSYLAGVATVFSLVAVVGLAQGLMDGTSQLPEGWPVTVIQCLALCLTVGVLEEFLFRGLLLGGLLARWGSDRRGVVASVAVSAAVFGLSHVAGDILTGPYTVSTVTQMVLKTLQTMVFGLLAGAAVVRSRNVWGAALMHAAADALPLTIDTLSGVSQESSYISADDSALPYILLAYGIILALYIPAVVRSVQLLRGASAPDTGPLAHGWETPAAFGYLPAGGPGAAEGRGGLPPVPRGLGAREAVPEDRDPRR